MSEFPLTQLKILVERAVRPVQVSACRKRKMREEFLAHVSAVFEEEMARLANEQAALERTAQRFGNPAELTGQLQESVPTLDSLQRFVERCAEGVFGRRGESTLRRAVRYTLLIEAAAFLLLFVFLLLVRRRVMGELPSYALWDTGPVLVICGYFGFTLCILESSMRRLLAEPTRRSWLRLALALVGLTLVSVTLGIWAFGVSPKNAFSLAIVTVVSPLGLAWMLAHDFAARKRYHEDWASLPIE